MKKLLFVVLALIIAMTCLFAGCEGGKEPEPTPKVAGVPEEPAAATKKIDVKEKKSKDYTTIEFGRYPSVELDNKKDAKLIADLNKIEDGQMDKTTGYYTYKDEFYQKEIKMVKDEEGVDVPEAHWFKVEPIKWIVLEESGSKIKVIAEENVLAVPFNTTTEDTNWALSSLRDWLNALNDSKNAINFYNSAFTADEKAVIVTQDIKTENNPQYKDVTSGEAVKDRVSLLSIEDFENNPKWADGLFKENKKDGLTLDRAASNTEYAIFKGAAPAESYDRKNSSWYWLRNSGVNNQYAAYVNEMGTVIPAGYNVGFSQISVRPVIVLDANNLNIK